MAFATDQVLAGRYRLGRRLGHGAMADVYEGTDLRLERQVAVKVMREDTPLGPDARIRFAAEARAAARLSHPNVVAIYDSGTDGTAAYIVMERLPGTTLADYLRGGPLPAEWVTGVAADALGALGAAHDAGLVHRDVKPANILLTADDGAKVADFGIAKAADATTDLTATGLVLGTAAYLPPERLEGQPASPQGDLYALGVVLYEALAGRKPFAGESPVALALAVRAGQPADLALLRPDLPAPLLAAIARAMAPDPSARFASAAEMAAALEVLPLPPGPAGGQVAPPTTPLPTRVASTGSGWPLAGPPPARGRARRRALLAAGAVVALLAVAGLLVVAAASTGRGTRSGAAGSSAATTGPAVTPRASAAPATTSPTAGSSVTTAPASGSATDPGAPATGGSAPTDAQAAALGRAAAALAGDGAAGSQAAALLRQVAALPAPLRAPAAQAAAAALQDLRANGGLSAPAYEQARRALASVAGRSAPTSGSDQGGD